MNKFLEKIAGWEAVPNFIRKVRGTEKKQLASKLRHVEDFLAKRETTEGLHQQVLNAAKETSKARLKVGIGAAGLAGLAGYSYHKKRQAQRAETQRQLDSFYKSASLGSAGKELGRETIGGVGRILNRIGRTAVDMSNTAHGGKIKDYAVRQGIRPDKHKKMYKDFSSGSYHKQVRMLMKRDMKNGQITDATSKAKHFAKYHDELRNLHKQKRDARIAIGGVGTTGILAYANKKIREKQEQTSYY